MHLAKHLPVSLQKQPNSSLPQLWASTILRISTVSSRSAQPKSTPPVASQKRIQSTKKLLSTLSVWFAISKWTSSRPKWTLKANLKLKKNVVFLHALTTEDVKLKRKPSYSLKCAQMPACTLTQWLQKANTYLSLPKVEASQKLWTFSNTSLVNWPQTIRSTCKDSTITFKWMDTSRISSLLSRSSSKKQ